MTTVASDSGDSACTAGPARAEDRAAGAARAAVAAGSTAEATVPAGPADAKQPAAAAVDAGPTGQTLSRKRRALQPLPRPPYLTTTPSKRHYKRYKPPKYAHSGPRLEDQPVQCLLTLFAFDRKQVP